ncbi:hypothetical protein [Methanolobus sp.]|uniref:hypothetical protein n=1 Tax=Methanolobus sp. TaxID=1874737 RepID=UPI0025CE8AA4|nr:hypothetical protein [Methanolobus sp.]
MDKAILAKLASCMDTITGYRIDFDEIEGKINLIYELLTVIEGPIHSKVVPDIW